MCKNFKLLGKHIISPKELCPDAVNSLLWTAYELKTIINQCCYDISCVKNFHITLLMDKSSYYIQSLTNHACDLLETKLNVIIDPEWSTSWQILDVSKYLSRHTDLILCHSKSQIHVKTLAEKSKVPIISVVSCKYNLLTALSDLMVIHSHLGYLENVTLSWIGSPCPLLNTYLCLLPRLKMNINYLCSCCQERLKSPFTLKEAIEYCGSTNTSVKEFHTLEDVLCASNVVTVADKDSTCNVKLKLKHLENAEKKPIILPVMPRHFSAIDDELFDCDRCLTWKSVEYSKWIYAAMILSVLIPYKHITEKPNFSKCDN